MEDQRQQLDDLIEQARAKRQAYLDIPQRAIDELARFCGANDSSFRPGAPEETHFNEGKRLVYLHIMKVREGGELDMLKRQQKELGTYEPE